MNPTDFLEGLCLGNEHRGGIRCLRLYRFDSAELAALRREIEQLRRRHRPSSVVEATHVTHWTGPRGNVVQYSLLNGSGRTDDFSADHDHSCHGKWFFDGLTYPVLGRLIADLPHLVNFRINVLGPGAALSAHEEHVPFRTRKGTIGARLRFHLPVETNPGAELNLDGLVFHLEAGALHLVNQGCVHSAMNRGASARVHLVWDCLLTAPLHRFLFAAGHAPNYLTMIEDRDPAPLRAEALGPFRRLPAAVSGAEAMQLALCDPQ